MDSQKEKSVISSLPFFIYFIFFLSIIAFIFPEVSYFFVYDRAAVLNGEIWRILTGHLVHFDLPHLLYNLIAFCTIGWMIAPKHYRNSFILCLVAAPLISISLVILEPEMAYYGGLSGLAYGLLFYLSLLGIRDREPWQKYCWVLLFIMPVKIFYEGYVGASIFPYPKDSAFIVVWKAHAVGGLTALFGFILQNIKKPSAYYPAI